MSKEIVLVLRADDRDGLLDRKLYSYSAASQINLIPLVGRILEKACYGCVLKQICIPRTENLGESMMLFGAGQTTSKGCVIDKNQRGDLVLDPSILV